MTNETFSVCQFFNEHEYEYVQRNVTAEVALKSFKHYTQNVASRIGLTKRVIITDSGDCIAMEWKQGEGVVFPPKGEDHGKS